MTKTQRTQQTSLDHFDLTMVPVVLGGPSLPRARNHGRPRFRRPADGTSSALHSAARERLSTPR